MKPGFACPCGRPCPPHSEFTDCWIWYCGPGLSFHVLPKPGFTFNWSTNKIERVSQ